MSQCAIIDGSISPLLIEEDEMHSAMDQLAKLPVSERLALVQDIWDTIAESRENLPTQE